MQLRVGVLFAIASCGSTPTPVLPATSPVQRAEPITFAWRDQRFTTNTGMSGWITSSFDDHDVELHIDDVPDDADVSGDVFEWAREGSRRFLHVGIQADLSALTIDEANTAPVDIAASLTVTLADGRTGTTRIPPVTLSPRTIVSWLFARPAEPRAEKPGLLYTRDGWLEVIGPRATLATFRFIGHASPDHVRTVECTYRLPESPEKLTVFLNDTRLTVYDRRVERVVASKTLPAPTGCPGLGGIDLHGRSNVADSSIPAEEVRAWFSAWMAANAGM